ncbi:hypothetical protein GSI_00093 [Ganoderma sinense ZZ0214-1]|uniref:Uncharacterized protein n=1 Tax=Ganoderma sinense ZZ0214-1 TaxID=1077348 RepID=A0A2G8SRK6_9APHY|nr:hypothetical protein GSI_00093 [Ganoderma sinense ZZ0214-1]
MRSSPFHLLLARTLAGSAATVSAQSPLPPPHFTAVFTGKLYAAGAAEYSTAGPFGTRTHLSATGGTLWNATTGDVVANIISFSDNGLRTDLGLNFPSSVKPLT